MKKVLAVLLAIAMLAAVITVAYANDAPVTIAITNPYEDVVWGDWGAYLGQLHTHTYRSDGWHDFDAVIEYHYYHGYDILAITDHGMVDRGWVGQPSYLPLFSRALGVYTRQGWSRRRPTGLTQERYDQITSGYQRDGYHYHRRPDQGGMLRVPFGIEQNPLSFRLSHTVSLFADFGHGWFGGNFDLSAVVRGVQRAGGISYIAHPSGTHLNSIVSRADAWEPRNQFRVLQFQRLLEENDSLIGLEIRDTRDRKLWDIFLAHLAPTGRNVFGLQTSDMHQFGCILRGYTWHMMPENTVPNVRASLETGAFFSGASSIHCAHELADWAITLGQPDFFGYAADCGCGQGHSWHAETNAYNRPANPKPMVENIAVQGNTITITGNEHVLGIQWIADGEVIYRTAGTSSTIDLEALLDDVGAHVRAELFGLGGVLYTQPFLLAYDGMPAATLTPSNFFDWGRIAAFFRFGFLYPLSIVINWLYR